MGPLGLLLVLGLSATFSAVVQWTELDEAMVDTRLLLLIHLMILLIIFFSFI